MGTRGGTRTRKTRTHGTSSSNITDFQSIRVNELEYLTQQYSYKQRYQAQ